MKTYSFNGLAGCVTQSRNRETGSLVGLYHNEQAGLDATGGDWSVVCESHATVTSVSTLADGRHLLAHPFEWCEECQ